ncbi:MAG TPA: amino acid permease [Bacteroidia bacterium]|nr:amino acid permease [Bacteroidota bacterium]MCW5932129.1 amino acid permease [Bacteroidota bacterium]HNR48514.1 amino acid permease [Bacteroidia bacterium]HNT82397.1 amino acid permease [Bacteroidia bacterium]HRV52524.1 amino acid permease [Bacteroidia bacterium]
MWDATMLVAGSMIGSGIFIVSSDMARLTGSAGWLLFLWVLSGLITLIAALCYGELAGMMPDAGGQFVFIKRAWGNTLSFLYGWTVFMVIQTGVIAAVAVAFARFTGVFIPFLSDTNILLDAGWFQISAAQCLAILLIVFLTWVNTKGIESGKTIQTFFTSAKLLALFMLIIAGLYVGMKTDLLSSNFDNAWTAVKTVKTDSGWISENISGFALILVLGTAIIGSLFSSDAWNNVTFIAGEIKDPKKNIPRSLLLGTGIVTVLYFLVNIAYLSLLPLKGDPSAADVAGQGIQFAGGGTDRVGTAAASMIFGDASVYIMAALIMISTFGCNNGIILSGARVYYAMALDKLFFKQAKQLNAHGVPAKALWFQAVWASVLCLSGTYGELLDYTIFASLLFYVVTIAGIFILRKREPDAPRPYKVVAYPLLPVLYIVLALSICCILLYTKTAVAGKGLLIVLLGLPVYYLFKRKQ